MTVTQRAHTHTHSHKYTHTKITRNAIQYGCHVLRWHMTIWISNTSGLEILQFANISHHVSHPTAFFFCQNSLMMNCLAWYTLFKLLLICPTMVSKSDILCTHYKRILSFLKATKIFHHISNDVLFLIALCGGNFLFFYIFIFWNKMSDFILAFYAFLNTHNIFFSDFLHDITKLTS